MLPRCRRLPGRVGCRSLTSSTTGASSYPPTWHGLRLSALSHPSSLSLPMVHSVRFSSAVPEFTWQSPSSVASTVPTATEERRLDNDNLADMTLFLQDAQRAATWNQGQEGKWYDKTCWDYSFCRTVVARYDAYLTAIMQQQHDDDPLLLSRTEQQRLLSAPTVQLVLKALLKSHYPPTELARQVRKWERVWGQLQQTPLTDRLSLLLVTANGKAGNVGRVLALLQLRQARNYPPQRVEFEHAVRSLQASTWTRGRSRRNPFLSDEQQQQQPLHLLDDPTRWLDAILLNMHQRDFALTVGLAAQMLTCFAAGPTGKAVHHFYRIKRQPTAAMPPEERPIQTDGMPKEWIYVQQEQHDTYDDNDAMEEEFQDDDTDQDSNNNNNNKGMYAYQPIKVQLRYHRAAPPFYKIPAQVRGKLLPPSPHSDQQQQGQFKLERECEPEYSYPLAAAFSFGDSLQQGACGHAGMQLDVACYNALIKASVHRGALWRAMHVLDQVMPSHHCRPNTMSFNHVLTGLARVGDVQTAQDYYMKMLAVGLSPDAFTVRAIVDGLINVGDLSGAVTVVQDFFNQHCILPPYTTHIKVLEFCLAHDMVYEAKRYVGFLQQLWNWQPNAYHSQRFIKLMKATQQNEQLQKEALQQLFAYFGEELTDKDFY